MRHRCNLAPAEATARAKVAFAVTGRSRPPGSAMRGGEVSWRHAQVIDQVLRQVPAERRDEAEQSLVDDAERSIPVSCDGSGTGWCTASTVTGPTRPAIRRLERRGLSVAETIDGMVSVNGLLDPVTGALLLTALERQVRPPRAP